MAWGGPLLRNLQRALRLARYSGLDSALNTTD